MASSYGHRPDVPRRDRNASSRKANNRLPGEDGRESQDLPDSVLSRYQRDAYQGRRSDSGPERFHGHADDDSVFAEPFQVRTERANDRSALYERDQGGYVGEKERRERKRAARRAKKRSKDIYKTPVSGKTRAKRVLWSLLGVLIVILVAMGFWMHALDQNMHIDDPELDDALSGHVIPGRPYYVLIVGSDARGDEASRTDTIILARVDPSENQLTLISIPRDTRVDIPGYGMSKINAAHA